MGKGVQTFTRNQQIDLTCVIDRDQPDRPSLSIELFNGLSETIHIFDSPRMPYFILQDDGTLLILHGVHAPNPEIDYGMIEIPLTRPLQPGASVSWQIDLVPLNLKNHYEAEREPADIHGPGPPNRICDIIYCSP